MSAMYSELAWPSLGAALADAEAGDGTALLAMADDYNGRASDGTYDSIRQSGPVIRCASGIDQTVPADPAALLAELHRVAPRFSRGYDLTDFRDMCLRPHRRGRPGDHPVVPRTGADRRRRRAQRSGDAVPLGRGARRPDGTQRLAGDVHGRGPRPDPVVEVRDRRRGDRSSATCSCRRRARPASPILRSPGRRSGTTCRCRTASGRSSTIRRSTSPSGCRRRRSTPMCGTCRAIPRPCRRPTRPASASSGSR